MSGERIIAINGLGEVVGTGTVAPSDNDVQDLDPDVWQVLDPDSGEMTQVRGVHQALFTADEHQGSNVDLPLYGEIDSALARLPHLLDAALARYETAEQVLPDLRYVMRLRWARALDTAASYRKSATGQRAAAELEVRAAKLEIEKAEMNRDVAQQTIKVLESQLSATQTRARMWIVQYEGDIKRGKP